MHYMCCVWKKKKSGTLFCKSTFKLPQFMNINIYEKFYRFLPFCMPLCLVMSIVTLRHPATRIFMTLKNSGMPFIQKLIIFMEILSKCENSSLENFTRSIHYISFNLQKKNASHKDF